ncbi:MAG TPA: hypothetical protein VFY65_14460, partial [Longimicrobium sp.]|nr:hypothetical protein [Longimicrobium sp.]
MKIFHLSPRRLALRSPAVLLVLAAACVNDDAPPTSVRAPSQGGELSLLQCQVQVASAEMSCVVAPGAGGVLASRAQGSDPSLDQRMIGGQGTYVRLANSGNVFAAGVLSMNVTVQNLSNLAMATPDGATRHAEGVRVFFYVDPYATGGAGEVTVANPTGTDIFTEANQAYFQYGGSIGGTDQGELGAEGVLASAETSAAKSWQFNVEAGVTSF